MTKLSPTSRKLLDAFDAAAQDHGWQRDQGFGIHVTNAEERHTQTKTALEARLARLEHTVRHLKVANMKLWAGDL